MNNISFESIQEQDMAEINGGALGGALAGAIIGGAVGAFVVTVGGIYYGNLTGNAVWKGYTAGALAGGGIGAVTPI